MMLRKGKTLRMQTTTGAPRLRAAKTSTPVAAVAGIDLLASVMSSLEDAKAEEIVAIDLAGKSAMGDHMVIASGRSARHVGAIAEQLSKKLKSIGHGRVRVEGVPACDWVLVDAGDVIVHVFRPEVRDFYNLEKMWSADMPSDVASDPLVGPENPVA
jgi:ribosome-associated protein